MGGVGGSVAVGLSCSLVGVSGATVTVCCSWWGAEHEQYLAMTLALRERLITKLGRVPLTACRARAKGRSRGIETVVSFVA